MAINVTEIWKYQIHFILVFEILLEFKMKGLSFIRNASKIVDISEYIWSQVAAF